MKRSCLASISLALGVMIFFAFGCVNGSGPNEVFSNYLEVYWGERLRSGLPITVHQRQGVEATLMRSPRKRAQIILSIFPIPRATVQIENGEWVASRHVDGFVRTEGESDCNPH
jgi:hypothetical protein